MYVAMRIPAVNFDAKTCVALISCCFRQDELIVRFLWSSVPLAFVQLLHLINEHVKWESDKEIPSG